MGHGRRTKALRIEDGGRSLAGIAEHENEAADDRAEFQHTGFAAPSGEYSEQPYGRLSDLNTERLILDAVGPDVLNEMLDVYLDLLGSSAAVYEKNGDHAAGICGAGWCRFLDRASRDLCGTDDNREALVCDKWHCHESCWQVSKASMETGRPADAECLGGLRIFAVPVEADKQIVGSVSFAYGAPPKDRRTLEAIAERFAVPVEELCEHAESYEAPSAFAVEAAKDRLLTSARLIGALVARKQAEENFRRLLESAPDAMLVANDQGAIVLINAQAERLFGYPREALVGKPVEFLVPERFRERHRKHRDDYMKHPRVRPLGPNHEFYGLRQDGTEVPVEISLSPLECGEGMLVCCAIRDITQRKELERRQARTKEELEHVVQQRTSNLLAANQLLEQEIHEHRISKELLRRSEARSQQQLAQLNHIYETAPVGLALVDTDLRFVHVNERLAALSGRPRSQHVGRSVREMFPQLAAHLEPIFRHVIQCGQPVLEREVRSEAADGKEQVWLVNSSPVLSAEKTVSGVSVVVLEITDRKRSEETVSESEKHFRELADASPALIFRSNEKGEFLYANRRWGEITGHRRETAMGNGFVEVIHPEDRQRVVSRWQAVVSIGRPWSDEIRVQRTDGSVIWVLGRAEPVKDRRGKVAGYVGTLVDMTELKRAEESARVAQKCLLDRQLEEKRHIESELEKVREELVRTTRLATLGQLSGSIAHELRNPLGAIRNAAFFLKGELAGTDEKCRKHLQIIEDEVKAANAIIQDLLDMSRGKQPQKQRVALAQLVASAWDKVGLGDGVRRNLSFESQPFVVHADPSQLEQVLANLLTNAGHAMGDRGAISVSAWHGETYDEIVVRDTGRGIAEEDHERVFEPLYSTKAKGTGLGLSLCRQIVVRHGGSLELLETVGEGAAFRIRLPREDKLEDEFRAGQHET